MRGFFILLLKELRSIKKEKTIMLAILIQFFIASFSSVILIGIMSFYDPTSIGDNTGVTIEVGVVGDTDSPLVNYLKERRLKITAFSDIDNAEDAYLSGEVDTIISLPEIDGHTVDMTLILPRTDAAQTLILMLLNEPFKKYENYLREVNGVELNYTNIEGKPHTTREFLYSVIIPILMLFPAFIAGSIVIDTISEEIENKTLDTLWAAPLSLNQIFSSKISAAVITSVLQCILWTVLLRFNNFPVENAGLVLAITFILAICISLGAAIIALYFKDRERAQFVFSIVLFVVAGISYSFNPSPFSLITRLAVGDHHIGAASITPYLLPMIALGLVFLLLSKKLVAARN